MRLAQRHAGLVPGARERIGELDLDARRLVEPARVRDGAAGEPRGGPAGGKRGEIQVVRAGFERHERPGGERGDRGAAFRLRARPGLQLGVDGQARERTVGLHARLPRAGGGGGGGEADLRRRGERRVGADAALQHDIGLRRAHGQVLHVVDGALVGAEMRICAEPVQRRQRIHLQCVDRQGAQHDLERQPQLLRRARRGGGAGGGAGDHLDAARTGRVELDSDPGAFVGPPAPARVAPGQAIDDHAHAARAPLDARGLHRSAVGAPEQARDGQPGHARQQPLKAVVAAQEPGAGGHQERQHDEQPRQRREHQREGAFRAGASHQNVTPTVKWSRQSPVSRPYAISTFSAPIGLRQRTPTP